jgi:mono/diheme cytochrome c family protein
LPCGLASLHTRSVYGSGHFLWFFLCASKERTEQYQKVKEEKNIFIKITCMKKTTVILILFAAISSFTFITKFSEDKPVPIPPSKQRTNGDAKEGYSYLVTGDYVKGGLPLNIFLLGTFGQKTYLQRDGLNKNIGFAYTAIKSDNGETLVAPNCLQCHAQIFEDQLIIGLGNSLSDFTKGQKLNTANIDILEKLLKANAPKQYEASAPFINITKTIAPYLFAEVKGVNIADKLAAILVAHRDPMNFKWSDSALMPIPNELIPTDTPPWWLLKKKNAMFYNGFGRGDFGRFLMASNLLTVRDTSESRSVDEHMPDVLAYIYSLQAPKYPKTIDQSLAGKGKTIFERNCSDCHGTYGANSTYPNLLIPESIIKTDSFLYKSNYSNPQFVNWFNKSWFTKGDHPAELVPFNGYIAPPLDGIWITAPYLHNGSVPTLEALLNSKLRPQFWSRDFEHPQYDYDNPGWKYKAEEKPLNTSTYNTNLPGYGNYGHYFGDDLTNEERKAVIEYLKTL